MARVPRCGTHDGIKYNKKRSLIRICQYCGQYFIVTHNQQKYCNNDCYIDNNRQQQQDRNFENNYDNNAKWNPINNANESDELRKKKINNWKRWYANLTNEQRQKYNTKKKQSSKKVRKNTDKEEYDSIQAELKSLGLR